MNDALLGRIGWNLIAKPQCLCSLVLERKYRRRLQDFKECIVKHSDSEIWKNVGRLWPKLIESVQWEIRDGKSVNFWMDKWVDDGIKMINHCAIPLQEEERKFTVRELVSSNGDWNYQKLEKIVTNKGRDLITAVPPPSDVFGPDRIKWGSNLQSKYILFQICTRSRGRKRGQRMRFGVWFRDGGDHVEFKYSYGWQHITGCSQGIEEITCLAIPDCVSRMMGKLKLLYML